MAEPRALANRSANGRLRKMIYCNVARLAIWRDTEGFGKSVLATITRNGAIDRLAIGLSGLCLVHCVGTAVLVMMLASAGGLLLDPRIHETGLTIAILLGVIGIGRGAFHHGFLLPVAIGSLGLGTMAGSLTLTHGFEEVAYSVIGVLILALGHDLNRRAVV
jgi:hypothetical protein